MLKASIKTELSFEGNTWNVYPFQNWDIPYFYFLFQLFNTDAFCQKKEFDFTSRNFNKRETI